ncbi:MAG: AbrB/MazE/SpoVT family DNA-binding domain-containing protein [Verrucomicrobia bacterium]|nr:AbrB/MazE/SpoVT family DNA-binding domain-containing protein [Verrucomicrobiota bacterium]
MKVTQKGQITIPKSFRDRYGLAHNTEVAFRAVQEGVLVYPVVSTRQQDFKRSLKRVRGIADQKIRTDDIMRMTRSDAARSDAARSDAE